MSSATQNIQEMKLPWGEMWDFSVPSLDVRWDKFFRVSLTALGGADNSAVVIIGSGDKPLPKDYHQVYGISLQPWDVFSMMSVTIEYQKRTQGTLSEFGPELRAQQTTDLAVTWDRMQPWDIYLGNTEQLVINFTNLSVGGPAGYDAHITGRIYREKN